MAITSRKFLIDADVLIDFQNSDFSVLREVNQFVGKICSLREILEEVEGLKLEDCNQVNLEIIKPKEYVADKAKIKRGRLSENDRLNLYTALDSDFVLVTNDSDLQRACKESNVKTIRGLRLLINLIENSKIPAQDIIEIAEKIHKSNSIHISREIFNAFSDEVKKCS